MFDTSYFQKEHKILFILFQFYFLCSCQNVQKLVHQRYVIWLQFSETHSAIHLLSYPRTMIHLHFTIFIQTLFHSIGVFVTGAYVPQYGDRS